MPVFQINHCTRPGANVYSPRGAVKELWKAKDFEVIVAGPAETGKTWGCCQKIDAMAWKYPGSQHVIARSTYTSLVPAALRTFQRILGPDSPVRPYGGKKPEWFDYPNGSRVWIVGLDNAGKALSSERDTIYVNQAEEIDLNTWETLSTRCTGRGAVMPYTQLFGDCNPEGPNHWILKRPTLKLFHSKHKDNPTLYDDKGQLTEQGVKTMTILKNLSGVRKLRLYFGRWVQAEGVVFENWGPKNVIKRMPRGWEKWRKIRSVDFGYTNPFVCQWWAIDPDGRMYLYREIYYSQRIVEDHVLGVRDPTGRVLQPGIIDLSRGERIENTVADHDREGRETMHRHGVYTTPAYKDLETGIPAVEARLREAGDGLPRLFVLEGCTVEVDEKLMEKRKPTGTQQEPDGYVWQKGKDGKPVKEEPVKENDHGMDATRYAVAYEDLRPPPEYVVEDEPAFLA